MIGDRSAFSQAAIWAVGGIAAVGWLVALYFWSDTVSLRADSEEALRRTEVARQELVGELQNLQQAVGSAADLRKRLDDGRKALDDAVAQRTSVQGDLAELTRKVDETELSLASETDQLDSKTALLKDTTANLKAAQDELAELAAQKAGVASELARAVSALQEAQEHARDADAAAVAAKSAEAEARAATDAAKAQLADLQAKISAARKPAP